jgi:hypothetical protein
LKISPDSKLVAFGAHGGNFNIEIMEVSKKGVKKKTHINARVSSAINHLDWSSDSEYILINSQALELLIFSVSSKSMAKASGMKDEEWQTMTCTLGWAV